MTVQELIDELMKVEDKSKEVTDGDGCSIADIRETDNEVILIAFF